MDNSNWAARAIKADGRRYRYYVFAFSSSDGWRAVWRGNNYEEAQKQKRVAAKKNTQTLLHKRPGK